MKLLSSENNLRIWVSSSLRDIVKADSAMYYIAPHMSTRHAMIWYGGGIFVATTLTYGLLRAYSTLFIIFLSMSLDNFCFFLSNEAENQYDKLFQLCDEDLKRLSYSDKGMEGGGEGVPKVSEHGSDWYRLS